MKIYFCIIIIDKKNYNKVCQNVKSIDKFQGALFIYDDNFSEKFETMKRHQEWIREWRRYLKGNIA